MAFLTAYWGLDGMILFLSIIVTAYIYMTRKFNHWKKKGIMEIKPTPFVGNFGDCLMMKKSMGQKLEEFYELGKGFPYVGFYILDKPFLLLRDPETIKRVLIKDFNYFGDRYARARKEDTLGSSNLLMIKNPEWKTLRAKLTPIFTSGKLKKMFELMEEVGKDLDAYLESEGLEGTGHPLEVKDICAKFTTDMIGTTAYGLKVNSLNNPEAEFRTCGRRIFDYNFRRSMELIAIFLIPGLVEPFGFTFFEKESSQFLRSVFWETIDERVKSGMRRNDLIDLLIDIRENQRKNPNQENGLKFEGDILVAQAAIFFTGGFETSSTTMSFTLYELSKDPMIQNRLRLEITEAIENNGGKITYDMVMALPYLDMVISETLRLYPVLTFLDRVTLQDYKFPETGLTVEKGTPIVIALSGLHHDPKYFPKPEVYDPERFSEENKKRIPPGAYIPFGDGPHICIGQRLGLLQSKLGVIHMISKYELSPCKETPIPMELDPKAFFSSSKGGLYLNFKKITTEAG